MPRVCPPTFDRGSLEGRVLDKNAPTLEFSKSVSGPRAAGTEASVLFVDPGAAEGVAPHSDETTLSPDDPDVWLGGDEERAEDGASWPVLGGHWQAPLQTLSSENLRLSGEWSSTLPALSIARITRATQNEIRFDAFRTTVIGRSTVARVTRLGVAVAAVVTIFAFATQDEPWSRDPSEEAFRPAAPPIQAPLDVQDPPDDTEATASVPRLVVPQGLAPLDSPLAAPGAPQAVPQVVFPGEKSLTSPGLVFDPLVVPLFPAAEPAPPPALSQGSATNATPSFATLAAPTPNALAGL